MRVPLMIVLAALLWALPLLGGFGSLELVVWALLWAGWLIALLKWAIPGDRRAKLSAGGPQ